MGSVCSSVCVCAAVPAWPLCADHPVLHVLSEAAEAPSRFMEGPEGCCLMMGVDAKTVRNAPIAMHLSLAWSQTKCCVMVL